LAAFESQKERGAKSGDGLVRHLARMLQVERGDGLEVRSEQVEVPTFPSKKDGELIPACEAANAGHSALWAFLTARNDTILSLAHPVAASLGTTPPFTE
jgi:hypothetical protein